MFLVLAGLTVGVLIRILWLEPRQESGTPPEQVRDGEDAAPPDTE
ncbi:hypothetical protein AB0K00_06510 [Dactylosporangium sp. NPDC049525]